MKPSKLIKNNPFILAPMDEVTDIAYRELCEKKGSSYTITELTSVEALSRGHTYKDRYSRGNLSHNCVQLFGKNPESFTKAAEIIQDEAESIDINFGCPSPSVTNNQESGASLLKDPKNVEKIVEKLVKHTDKPITAKIRLGYKKTTYKEVATKIENAGADLLAIHGRTAEQKYSGTANWDAIEDVYNSLERIKVVGNGDIKETKDIDDKLNIKCSALMIGRAAIGNPDIFKQFNQHYKNKNIDNTKDIKSKQKELFKEYINLLENYDIHKKNTRISRQAMWFFKGISGVKELRKNIMEAKSVEEVLNIVEEF